jgi:SAM-dependent methyltransferase
MALVAKQPSVLDIGSSEPFSKWLEPYKALFAGVTYKSLDNDPATGADVVGDIHSIPLPDNSIDAIICSSVLEHVRDPLRAMSEMRRILKPGGCIFLFVPSIYPYHQGKNGYPDFWRFFGDTMPVLLEGFSHIEVQKRGGYFLALSYFIPRQHAMRHPGPGSRAYRMIWNASPNSRDFSSRHVRSSAITSRRACAIRTHGCAQRLFDSSPMPRSRA